MSPSCLCRVRPGQRALFAHEPGQGHERLHSAVGDNFEHAEDESVPWRRLGQDFTRPRPHGVSALTSTG